MDDQTFDAPEFTDEQLRDALKTVGSDARKAAFAAGQPVVIIRDGSLVALYRDGTEKVLGVISRGNNGAKSK